MQVLKDEIRENIKKAAEELFYQKGFADTTTRNIADAVGIRVSNLYLYYENKEDIFIAVIGSFCEYLNANFQRFLTTNNVDEDISDGIYRLVLDFILRDRRKFIILADKSEGTRFENAIDVVVQGLKRHICSLLSEEIKEKELLAYILSSNLVRGTIEIAKAYKEDDQLKESIKYLVTYHTEGLKAIHK